MDNNGKAKSPAMTHAQHRQHLPRERTSIVHNFSISGLEITLTVGLFDDGRPGEIFFKTCKQGSTLSGLFDTIGMMVSLALQYGTPVDVIAAKLKGMSFEPSGWTQNKSITRAESISDYVGRYLEERFVPEEVRRSNVVELKPDRFEGQPQFYEQDPPPRIAEASVR